MTCPKCQSLNAEPIVSWTISGRKMTLPQLRMWACLNLDCRHQWPRDFTSSPLEKTKESLFVLFTVPQQRVASGACYIALDGYPTILRSKGARFSSYAAAKAFAKENRIALNGLTYIGLEDFTDVDLKGSEAFNHSESDSGTYDDDDSSGCLTREVERASRSFHRL